MSDGSTAASPVGAGLGAPARPAPRGGRYAPVVLAAVAAVALVFALLLAWRWWTIGRFIQTTNDAYLHADQVTVAPKVQGYVEAVFVGDNQTVQKDQPLVKIDADAYEAAMAQQRAGVAARQADLATALDQVRQQAAAVDQSRAQLDGARSAVAYAKAEADRYRALAAAGVETVEKEGQTFYQRDQAVATARSDEAALREAERRLATLRSQVGQARAQLLAAEAQARSAALNLGDTTLRAGLAGRVGDRSVRVGQFVQPGTRLMTIVPTRNLYLIANFKETQIGRMRPGQTASVKLDALPDQRLKAVVDSFAPGTGAQFALLPPENATGNFTKIVQRVPVRLRLEAPAELTDRLLPGLSATVAVDTGGSTEASK